MKQAVRRLVPLVPLVLLVVSCADRDGSAPAVVPDSPLPPPAGAFRAEYGLATLEYNDFRQRLIANRFLDTVAARLNDSLIIPRNITLTTAHCGEPNASYDPERTRVILCYELFRTLADMYADEVGGDHLIMGTLVFALTHELGHALIDVLDLPATGREEDAVDQLATILMLGQGDAGDSLAFGAVGWFAKNAQSRIDDDLVFAGDHGLSVQRYYNILCMVYGRDRARYPEILTEGWLPADRASRCPAEYARIAHSWRRLLWPHKRKPEQGAGP